MIMEYVRGPSLRQLMDQQPLTLAQGMRVLGDISAALEYASKIGIIHRDLKPGNVFVTVAGPAKLGDFGLVKMVSGQANFQTQAGTILGTPAYMSPEQAAGKADIDQRTDVYSLAVMSYELLTGRLPFPSVPGQHHGQPRRAHLAATAQAQRHRPGLPQAGGERAPGRPGQGFQKRPKTASEF